MIVITVVTDNASNLILILLVVVQCADGRHLRTQIIS